MSQGAAFVTGAARGIGRACAEALLADGYTVTIADADAEAARATADVLGAERTLAVTCDVRSSAAVDAAIARAHAHWGRLDALVNNAGVIAPQLLADADDAAWAQVVDVHVGGAMRCCRAAYAALRDAPAGAVVSIGSVAARLGIPHRASYGSAKAALEG
jgi:NAD(P)-dependent dehydrogenase (short-subunit alcohol dehydrogenase family)